MTVRPYRLYDNNTWMSYKNLKAACWDFCVKLYNMNHLDLVHTGTFEPTVFLNETHHKRYVVRLLFPYTVFRIEKMTKGDLDQEMFTKTLHEVYEMFNERIQHKD
jgi:uncharacterized protein (UPF0305 family)